MLNGRLGFGGGSVVAAQFVLRRRRSGPRFRKGGFQESGLALDRNVDSVRSYNENRPGPDHGHVVDVGWLTPTRLDKKYGRRFVPTGVIGGPPCQSFSQANVNQHDSDPRHAMPVVYANLVRKLNMRDLVDFFVLENVVGLTLTRHRNTLRRTIERFENTGFEVTDAILNLRKITELHRRASGFF